MCNNDDLNPKTKEREAEDIGVQLRQSSWSEGEEVEGKDNRARVAGQGNFVWSEGVDYMPNIYSI